VTKTNDHATMEQLGNLLLNTLLVEKDLHHRYGERFGLTPDVMAATPLAPTNYAYTHHLLSLAALGTFSELLTAILPLCLDLCRGRHAPYHSHRAIFRSPLWRLACNLRLT
jgi:thiaminase/transcriptional activator TenA